MPLRALFRTRAIISQLASCKTLASAHCTRKLALTDHTARQRIGMTRIDAQPSVGAKPAVVRVATAVKMNTV